MPYPCLTNSSIYGLNNVGMFYTDYEPIEEYSKENQDKLTYHMHTTGSHRDAIVLIKWFNG